MPWSKDIIVGLHNQSNAQQSHTLKAWDMGMAYSLQKEQVQSPTVFLDEAQALLPQERQKLRGHADPRRCQDAE